MVMVAPQSQHELASNGVGLVHRVAQSPLGDLWIALDQRRGPPGEPVLLRYVALAGGATLDTLDRVVAAAQTAMGLRHELLLPVVDVLQQGPLAIAYQYVEAQPLSTLQTSARERELLFPVGVALRLIIDLLRALQAVHESWLGWPTEVPYGGLMPASVLVSREGRTQLCDALVASSVLLQRGSDLNAAELAYRAPEQVYASSPPEPSTDVFIATILLWELLSGQPLLSGSKEVIEQKLLEHDLPRASADLRPDGPLSRGLLELLDVSLSLNPNRRPPDPGGLATALERCGHVVASHAEVAAFVQELAGPQLEQAATLVRLARGYAAAPDDEQLVAAVPSELADEPETPAPPDLAAAPPVAAAAPWDAEAPPSSDAATQPRERAVAPPAAPAGKPARVAPAGKPAAAAPPGGVTPSSLAGAVALALERRRASGEFPAFGLEAERAVPPATSLGSWAALSPARVAAAKGAAAARSVRAGSQPPLPALVVAPFTPPLSRLREDDTSSEEEEEPKTTVLRAVSNPDGIRSYTAPAGPVRLAPKRALLAAIGAVVLLIQLWMFALARSERVETKPESPGETTADPLGASER